MNMKNSLKTGHLGVLFRRAGDLREAARSVRALGLARRARRATAADRPRGEQLMPVMSRTSSGRFTKKRTSRFGGDACVLFLVRSRRHLPDAPTPQLRQSLSSGSELRPTGLRSASVLRAASVSGQPTRAETPALSWTPLSHAHCGAWGAV